MVFYINEDFLKKKPFTINKFFSHKIDDDHILVTTEHGSWVVLSKKQHNLLLTGGVMDDFPLFEILESKGIILTQENEMKLIETYRERFDYIFNGIGLHIISPTLRCNQRCVYCHSNSKDTASEGYDMDEDTAKKVVDFIFQTPSKTVNIEFQGGEPLTNFTIIQYIIEYSKTKNNSPTPNSYRVFPGKKNLLFTIVSNLTLMDNDILNYLIENRVRISTSLDGPKELHDKNRFMTGSRSSYENVVQWIGEIRRRGYPINSLPTITKHSLDYPREIVDEYIRNGFNRIRMRELNIAGMAISNWKDVGYTPEEFIRFWDIYFDYLMHINRGGTNFSDESALFILKRALCRKSTLNACLNSPCGVGTIQTAYDYKGDIYTCDEARSNKIFRIGNVKESSYSDVFTSKDVENFIRLSSCRSFSCENCVWQAFCSPCIVSTYGETNNMIPRFPNFVCKIRGFQTRRVFERLVSGDMMIMTNWLRDNINC